jgi:hypothetical protein
VQLVDVDIVGAEPLQGRVNGLQQMETGRTDGVGVPAVAERALGGDQNLVAPSLDRLAEHLFSGAARIDVGAVEHVEARIQAKVDHPLRLGAFDRGETDIGALGEGAGPKTQGRNHQARGAQLTIFHETDPFLLTALRLVRPAANSNEARGFAAGLPMESPQRDEPADGSDPHHPSAPPHNKHNRAY